MESRTFSEHTYTNDPAALTDAWATANTDKRMRVREAANFLGVSEAELVATQVGSVATRLKQDWISILQRVQSIGRVMALTRNDNVVHERKGVYLNTSATGQMGLVLGDDIDLRLFLSQWQHGYALTEIDGELTKRSLQFFDDAGDAVHKIFLQPDSETDEFELVVEQFRADNQTRGERVYVRKPAKLPVENPAVDVAAFRHAWANLKDTHEFFGMLKKFNLARTHALRLAEPQFAQQVELSAAKKMLEAASAKSAEIMCFVGNAGCIQIHTGPVSNIKVMGPWLNVLDVDFNLHLRQDMLTEAWVVKKPTVDGIVTSLELYDATGTQLTQFFGKRKPGNPERQDWRDIIATIEASSALPTAAVDARVPA